MYFTTILRTVRWLAQILLGGYEQQQSLCLSSNNVETVNNRKITLAKIRRQPALINTYLYITLATVDTNETILLEALTHLTVNRTPLIF
jgi:hypothetical protein